MVAAATTSAAALALAVALFLLAGSATSNTTFFSCSPTNAISPNSIYRSNLRSLLSSLPSAAISSRFANLSIGTAPDRIFGLAQCRGDSNSSTCLSCLTTATADVEVLCPGSRSAAVFYDQCRIRFSDTRFFSTITQDPPEPYFFSLYLVDEPDYFRERVSQLLPDLRNRAAFRNGSGMFASGWVEYGLRGVLYGLVQCSRDLSGEDCAQCLEGPIRRITCCESSVEMTYQGGSCYLRYSFQLFFNGSVFAPPPLSRPGISGNATAEVGAILQEGGGGKNSIVMVVAIVVGAILLVLLVLIAIKTKTRKRRQLILGHRTLDNNENTGLMFGRLSSRRISYQLSSRYHESGTLDLKKLDMQMIKVATDNFSELKKLASGEYGIIYKGELPGKEFIIKRMTAIPRLDIEVIKREFKSLCRLQHPNLVKLFSYHMAEENLLIYEFLPNTSLDKVLFDNKKKVLLDWGRRFKIIQGIAQGLLYLQGDSGMNLIHQNMKASNILLDKHMAPKLSGFCLPRFFTTCESPDSTKQPSPTSGYMAPESATNGIYTAKTDIFSYGVLVLEIITGQRNRALIGSNNAVNLLSYVWQCWRDDKAVQVLDWSLGELYKKHEVLRCIHVGLLCVQEDPDKRPGITAIVHMLSSFSFTPPAPAAPAVVRAGTSSFKPPDDLGNSDLLNWRSLSQTSGPAILR